MIRIADLRCACGTSDPVVAIDPGSDEIRDLFLLKRGRPAIGRCMRCLIGTPAIIEEIG